MTGSAMVDTLIGFAAGVIATLAVLYIVLSKAIAGRIADAWSKHDANNNES